MTPQKSDAREDDPFVGRTLKQGEYQVLARLGSGGMGAVYRGQRTKIGKVVALKVLKVTSDSAVEQQMRLRFFAEARFASKLQHPHIAQVFDYWEEPDCHVIAMEYVDGLDLSEIMRREGEMAPRRALAIIHQVALALLEAERLHIVHRDIKPSNIRLSRYEENQEILVKVLDFGIAKRLTPGESGSERHPQTAPGLILGTPDYMAPEQVSSDFAELCRKQAEEHGQKTVRSNVDSRADLYATGVILFEMLTGRLPFEGEGTSALTARLMRDAPPLPETVPAVLRHIVARLLMKDPYQRYQSAQALIDALRQADRQLPNAEKEHQPKLPPNRPSLGEHPTLSTPQEGEHRPIVERTTQRRKIPSRLRLWQMAGALIAIVAWLLAVRSCGRPLSSVDRVDEAAVDAGLPAAAPDLSAGAPDAMVQEATVLDLSADQSSPADQAEPVKPMRPLHDMSRPLKRKNSSQQGKPADRDMATPCEIRLDPHNLPIYDPRPECRGR